MVGVEGGGRGARVERVDGGERERLLDYGDGQGVDSSLWKKKGTK